MAGELDLCQAFIDAHPDAAARAIERLPTSQAAALLDAMPADAAARAVAAMTPSLAADCLAQLGLPAAGLVIAALPIDRASMLVRHMDESRRAAIVERLPPEDARMLAAMLRYPAGTAGALMDPRVLAIADETTVGGALAVIRRSSRHLQDYLFVVDRDQRLVGIATPGALMRARPRDALASLMTSPVSRLPALAGRAAILAHPAWGQLRALPVVDEASLLLGAISYETFRTLELEAGGRAQPFDTMTTVFALGELYWLSLSGMLDGAASIVRRTGPRPDAPEGVPHGSV